jgi:hypothetical protein
MGMLFIHNESDTGNLITTIEKIIDIPELLQVLEYQYVTFALDASSKDAKNVKYIN